MKVRRDQLGIPILDSGDIEDIAQHFLAKVAPSVLAIPSFTPLAEIADQLQKRELCTFSFNEDLGETANGHKYLGYFDIRRRHIAIDACLGPDDARFPFTLAHEFGHFYLHGKVKAEALGGGREAEIRDSTRDLVTHRIEATRPRTLLEWQANRFAAAILIPRATAQNALISVQRSRGIRRRLGTLWLDRQPANRREYPLTVAHLASFFRVSRAVVRYRLGDLGLSHTEKGAVPVRLGDELGSVLEELFAEGR